MHQGLIALSEVEANGIRIDMEKLTRTKEELKLKIRSLKQQLEAGKLWKLWRRRFAAKASMTSKDQLATLLFDELGFEIKVYTEKGEEHGRAKVNEEVLQNINHPDLPALIRYQKYDKALGTFLLGIEREVVDGRLHPNFNLNIARTYRSSSDNPNFQNFPVRDKEVSQIIRSCFMASQGGCLAENDFKGVEVGVSACYHKDPNFIDYLVKGKDMHGDMAAQIYKLERADVSKEARYGAKNKFVFPQFYGDWYMACAKNLWEWIIKGKLTGPNGIPMMKHLKTKGIRELGECDPEQEPRPGTFEKHLKEVEQDFWNVRFQEYGRWRKQAYRDYIARGYFDLKTGFRIFGVHGRKDVTNYPIQGSAFHCLLWTLIQVQRKLKKYNLRSRVVGQIHDSLIGDVPVNELRDYLEIVQEIVSNDLRKHYTWLIVPLEIECEICPSDGSWFDKKEVKFEKGRFKHPTKDRWTADSLAFMKALNQFAKEPKK